MSQAGSLRGGGSGGSGVTTITGNTGGALSGSNINIVTANSTVLFAGSGTTETLDFDITNLLLGSSGASLSGAFRNASVGSTALRDLVSGGDNSALGDKTMQQSTTIERSIAIGSSAMQAGNGTDEIGIGYRALRFSSGGQNIAIGTQAMSTATVTGTANIGIGSSSLGAVVSGGSNIALGYFSGSGISGASSSNIAIGSAGAAESNTIRIGTQGAGLGQQNRNFQAGITGVTVAASEPVAVASTGQLSGLGFGTAAQVLTSNGAATSPTWQAVASAPAFRAYLNANTAANQTGDGTFVTFPFDTVLFERGGSNFDTANNRYVIPSTGYYQFTFTSFCYNIDATNTVNINLIDLNGTATRVFEFNALNTSSAGELIVTGSLLLSCTAGDFVTCQTVVGGAAKNVGFGGGATLNQFSGFKVL